MRSKLMDAQADYLEADTENTLKHIREALDKLDVLDAAITKLMDEGKMGVPAAQATLAGSGDIRLELESLESLHYRTLLFVFGPCGTQFQTSAELVIPWDEVLDSNEMSWYSGSDGEPVDLVEMGCVVDPVNETVTFFIDHFSRYYFERRAPQQSTGSAQAALEQLQMEIRSHLDTGAELTRSARIDTLPAPSATKLLANYPNPFNPETWIPFELAQSADVQIQIHDASGRLIRSFDLGHRPAGTYTARSQAVYWDGRNDLGEHVSSGVYLYRLTSGEFSAIKRMVIMK